MKPTTFDKIVKNRAAQRAQGKISIFRTAIYKALSDLGFTHYNGKTMPIGEEGAIALRRVLDGKNKGWPASIWRKQEELVTEELLATMDEMQKALLAPEPDPEGDRPAGEEG